MRKRQASGHSHAFGRLKVQLCEALRRHLHEGGRPRVPVAGVMLWQAFATLCEGRTWRGGIPDPIRWGDGVARLALARIVLHPHHVEALEAMDAEWLAWAAVPAKDRVAGPLTGAAFDAMFG